MTDMFRYILLAAMFYPLSAQTETCNSESAERIFNDLVSVEVLDAGDQNPALIQITYPKAIGSSLLSWSGFQYENSGQTKFSVELVKSESSGSYVSSVLIFGPLTGYQLAVTYGSWHKSGDCKFNLFYRLSR